MLFRSTVDIGGRLALHRDTMSGQHGNLYPLTPLGFHPPPTTTPSPIMAETTLLRRTSTATLSAKLSKENECRSRLAFALLVFFYVHDFYVHDSRRRPCRLGLGRAWVFGVRAVPIRDL